MPDFTVLQIGILALTLIIGFILGWVFRGDRCAKEKIAVNASWGEQIEAQQSEHDRLAEQNVSLMEQIGQYQASNKDSTMRAKELSDALKEAFERRDELQRSLKEVRSKLDVASAQRDRLLGDIESSNVRGKATADALKEKDDKIFRLSRELKTWQSRVPPLVEKFKERDQEVAALQSELAETNERIAALKAVTGSDQTRIEPLDADTLPEGLDASNEPHDTTISDTPAIPEDQIDPSLTNQPANAGNEDDASRGDGTLSDYLKPDVDFASDESVDAAFTETEVAGDASESDDDDASDSEQGEAAEDEQDDLKQIKGVGPAIEKTLNELGIFRFNQIAEMSEYDIDRVAQQLRGFRSRIYREDWIGQARNLQYQKNNDPD